MDGAIYLRQCGAHARPQPDQVRVRPLRTALPHGFCHPNDFVKDKLQVWRSDLEYAFNDKWRAQWQLAHRTAAQDFDHFYAGSENGNLIKRNYAWQQTDNKTLSSNFTLNGDYNIGRFENHLTVGMDYSREHRNPDLGLQPRLFRLHQPLRPRELAGFGQAATRPHPKPPQSRFLRHLRAKHLLRHARFEIRPRRPLRQIHL